MASAAARAGSAGRTATGRSTRRPASTPACPNLYAYDDERGRRIVGCVERVFTAEIDLEVFERVRESNRGRFGLLRAGRRPLPICRASVERAYADRLPPVGCVNPEFAEPVDGEPFRITARV